VCRVRTDGTVETAAAGGSYIRVDWQAVQRLSNTITVPISGEISSHVPG